MSPTAGLVVRHSFGRTTQCTSHPHITVPGVVQFELEPKPQAVAHGQRDFQPARGGDHHVDAVRQADVDQFGDLRQQRVPGVELVGVVAAERVEVVDDQEDLAEPVVEHRSSPVPEHLTPLTGAQQLLELTEGATDALGFQR